MALAPPPYTTDREQLEAECRVEYLTRSGPGGQHRNRSRTGVRLTHVPSGLIVMATEKRSQKQNLEAAFERLIERLDRLNQVPAPRRPTRIPRACKTARRQAKTQRSQLKKLRRRPSPEGS